MADSAAECPASGKVARALSALTIVTHIHSGIGGPAGPAFFQFPAHTAGPHANSTGPGPSWTGAVAGLER